MFSFRRSIPLAIMATGALAFGLAACSGDDDDIASPTPTPYNPDICFIVWAKANSVNAANFDAYFWQAAATEVANGAGNYVFNTGAFDSVLGFFYYNTNATLDAYAALGVNTAGDYTLTIDGLQMDDNFDFADTTNNQYFDVPATGPLGAQIASNGTGTFDGVLSDPEPGAPATPGTGTLTIAYAGSSLALGALDATCVDSPNNPFTSNGNRPAPEVLEAVRRILRNH